MLILGSASPRRKELLQTAGYTFEIMTVDGDESAPVHLSAEETVLWVAKEKANAIWPLCPKDSVLITSDTEVWKHGKRYGKPANSEEAFEMIKSLSGTNHQVITGLYVTDGQKSIARAVTTEVYFKNLSDDEIRYYIEKYKPFDKAGAYGIQEYIGLIGIERIEGSYYNVVGLPVAQLSDILSEFGY